ncbi:MAG: DUF2293 domain-containing protein [Desulforhopalus sp.]|nr:DUF2293 domain-containing protein [Desulforhopalus sp.]
MSSENRTVKPGRKIGVVLTETGEALVPSADWELLPPGDGVLTRLVKSKGPSWQVQVKVGRRTMSRGIWASKANIQAAIEELAAKRAAPGYDLRRQREKAAKEKKHLAYVGEFYRQVVEYLDFHPRYADFADRLAEMVTSRATPVGSGTVARTERIPVADRAKAAVVAWLRHQATDYDRMTIARVKGRRREVRRELAGKSLQLLVPYRRGEDIPSACPLRRVLSSCGDVGIPQQRDTMGGNSGTDAK